MIQNTKESLPLVELTELYNMRCEPLTQKARSLLIACILLLCAVWIHDKKFIIFIFGPLEDSTIKFDHWDYMIRFWKIWHTDDMGFMTFATDFWIIILAILSSTQT